MALILNQVHLQDIYEFLGVPPPKDTSQITRIDPIHRPVMHCREFAQCCGLEHNHAQGVDIRFVP